MIVSITPSAALGSVTAPPSKSIAHRQLICGALSTGSIIHNLALSEDIKATVSCLQNMGANTKFNENNVLIGGLNPFDLKDGTVLNCNESGSTLRFLIPLCLLSDKEITLTGSERLFERPLNVYEELCKSAGLYFKTNKNSVTLKGPLQSGTYRIAGNISSQFISGLLFALPLLENESKIDITGATESLSYIKLTLKALGDFGIRVNRIDENTLLIPGSQRYKIRELSVEGDYSNAAFLEAFNLFGGNVAVDGLSSRSFQGDRVYRKHFQELCTKKPCIDLTDCPDLAPILFAVAAAKNGAEFTGTARLKIKESDRAEAMKEELAKFGISVCINENSVIIEKGELKTPTQKLYGHNDHRIVMALSVLCTITGGTIMGAEAVAKSFPDFFKKLSELGIIIKAEKI